MEFRKLKDDFLRDLKDKKHKLHYILDFEKEGNNRKSFMVEIRKNFLDLYYLGHTIEVRKKGAKYYLRASRTFNPKDILPETIKNIIRPYDSNRKWQVEFSDMSDYRCFKNIINAAIMKIVLHKKGKISEGVSEINHFVDNRDAKKNGILVIDRQVVYPNSGRRRIDLLGIKKLKNGKYTFSVIELKNKNNKDIVSVFKRQLEEYINIVFNYYEHFAETYSKVINQKISLGLLKKGKYEIEEKSNILKRHIEGVAILDNYNMKSDLKENGRLSAAIKDWSSVGTEYIMKLFLKTNILDNTFFLDRNKAAKLLNKYKSCNL